MKKNKFMIASLLILVGMGAITVSCKKEEVSSRKAQMITESDLEKTGDEDPIIRVRVKKKNTYAPVDNAHVETFVYGTNVRINDGYTNSSGEYDRQVAVGIYYFHVTPQGSSTPVVTDTIHVDKDVMPTILVD